MLPIHVWQVEAGDEQPRLVTIARLFRGSIEGSDPVIQGWLASGVARILAGRPRPTSDEDDLRLHQELCALRSGTAYLCTLEAKPFVSEDGG